MRVALVSTAKTWHGGEQQARLLASGLRRRGHDCLILARGDGQLATRFAEDGFAVQTFPGRGKNPLALWKIRAALRSWQPDVIHYNDAQAVGCGGLASLGIAAARIAARRVDFPIRSTFHYRRWTDRVVCVSDAVADVCRRDGLPGHGLRVVHDGVDPQRVRQGDRARGRSELGLSDEQLLLLTVAKLTDHKGHRYLLEALPHVLHRHPHAVLALAGHGELAEQLQARARQLGVARQVRFLGFRSDVPDLIQAADLFVLPSHMEGLCSTLIDVMFASRPIVTTLAGGIPELLAAQPSDGGPLSWLVPARNPAALGRAIVEAIDDPAERHRRRQRALARAERLFTADRMVESTIDVYKETLASTERVCDPSPLAVALATAGGTGSCGWKPAAPNPQNELTPQEADHGNRV